MKLFISGPMTGYPGYNREAFTTAELRLSQQGHTVLSPASHIPLYQPEAISHEDYLHICLAMLDVCDGIYLLRGWRDSKGAWLEYNYAFTNRKIIMYEENEYAN